MSIFRNKVINHIDHCAYSHFDGIFYSMDWSQPATM